MDSNIIPFTASLLRAAFHLLFLVHRGINTNSWLVDSEFHVFGFFFSSEQSYTFYVFSPPPTQTLSIGSLKLNFRSAWSYGTELFLAQQEKATGRLYI